MYAVIELKYDKGKILLAKKIWLLKQQKIYNKTEDVFCYWSPDLNDSKEDIKAEYMKTFTGEPGLFKVFVLKLADTLDEAQKALEGRVPTIAKRFRDPGNTDEEFKQIEAKKKRTEKKDLKSKQAKAHTMNIQYLIEEMSPASQSSKDSEEVNLSIIEPTHVSPTAIVNLSEDSPAKPEATITSIVPVSLASPIIHCSPKASSVLTVEQNPSIMASGISTPAKSCQPAPTQVNISSTEWPIISSSSTVHQCPTVFPVSAVESITLDLPKHSNSLVDDKDTSIHFAPCTVSNVSAGPSTLPSPTIQQTQALSEISFDLSSLGIRYDDIIRDLLGDGSQIEQTIEHAETPAIDSETTGLTSLPSQSLTDAPSEIISSNKRPEKTVLSYDDLLQKNKELSLENQNLSASNQALKEELESSNKRNLALQNHLVAVNERVPETLYTEKDGGRLYDGDVFLSKNQCLVLEKSKSDSEYLNNLLICIFGREVLMNHSLTGRPSNRTKKTPKPALDKKRVELIYKIMEARSVANKTKKLKESEINAVIGKKLANLASYEKKKP